MYAELKVEFDSNEINFQQSSNLQGVLMENISSEYAEKLHGNQLNPYSQCILKEEGKTVWYLKTLNTEAYEMLLLPMTKLDTITLRKKNKTVNLFVLAGCWECPDDIGVTVVAISSDEKQLIDRLDQIADTQAKEYVSIEGSILMEEHTDTRYEISGGISGNARFYITEEPAVINEALMGEISRAMSKNDRTEDVKNYLQGLFENGNLDEEKYEELVDSEEFLQKAVELFDKMEDCNTPFNTTMELAVGEARKEMTI